MEVPQSIWHGFSTPSPPPPLLWPNYIGTAPFPGRGFPAVLEYSHLNCFLAWLRWPSVWTTLFPTRWFVKGGHIWFRITSLQRDNVSYLSSIGGLRKLPEDLLLQICMMAVPQIYEGKTLLHCKSYKSKGVIVTVTYKSKGGRQTW